MMANQTSSNDRNAPDWSRTRDYWCRQNLKFGDFTLLFCGVRQRNARKFVLLVQHEHFSIFDQ